MSGSLPNPARSRWPLIALLLVAGVLVSYGYFFNSGSWNQNARLDAIFNFVEPGPDQWSFRIDRFLPAPQRGLNTGDWNHIGEHYYANKLPGTILWGTLGYLPWYWALRLLGFDPTSLALTSASAYWVNLWTTALPLAVAAWMFSSLLTRRGAAPSRAIGATLALFLGTALFPYATQLWGHPTSAACVCGALFCQWAPESADGHAEGAIPRSDRRALWAGLWAGLAVCADFMAAPFALATLVWALRRSRREAVRVVLGGGVGLLCILGYDWYCFGSPLRFPIDGTNPGFLEQKRVLGIFGGPSLEALWQLTFGSYRGILVQMPISVLALLGFVHGLRSERKNPLLWGALSVVVATLWLAASFNGWHGGASVSARYLIPCLPLLALGLAELPAPLWTWPLQLAVGAWSFLNMLAIAAVNPLVDQRADNPLYRIIYPYFAAGDLGAQRLPLRLQALNPSAGTATTANLGALLGLGGIWQLLPLLAGLGVLLAFMAHELGLLARVRARWAAAGASARQSTLLSVLLVLVSAGYALSVPSALLGGDNAEFVTLSQRWGVAHPAGYPAYVLYLRLLSWLPGTTFAMTAALATALLGVATLFVLYRACRSWQATPFAALALCAFLAWSPRFWIAATHADVFALNALFAVAIVWLCAPELGIEPGRRLCWLGGLAGLGLCNHVSLVLLAPLGLTSAICSIRQCRCRVRATALGLGCFLLGLSPYACLPLLGRTAHAWSWGELHSLPEIWAYVLREDAGRFRFGMLEQGGTPLRHWAQLFWQSNADLFWLPLCLLPFGLLVLLRSRHRGHGLGFFCTLLSTGPLFVSRSQFGFEGLARAVVVERFYLLPELIAVPILALGLGWLEEKLRPRLRPAFANAAGWASGIVFASARLLGSWPELSEHHAPTVERYLQNTLRSVPQGAVILGTGEQRLFGFAALQELEGLRRDVQYIDPSLLHHDGYRRRAAQRFGAPLSEPREESVDALALADRLLASGKPLFITDVFADVLVRARPSYAVGTLIRILPAGSKPPEPAELEQANLQLFAHFDLNYPRPLDVSSWAWNVQELYARPWSSLAGTYHQLGDEARAALNERRSQNLSPGL